MAIFIGCLLIYVSISTFFWLIYDIPWYEKLKNSFILAILMGSYHNWNISYSKEGRVILKED
jgi:hypothetical protein